MIIQKKTDRTGTYWQAIERTNNRTFIAEGNTFSEAFTACLTLIKENTNKEHALKRVK